MAIDKKPHKGVLGKAVVTKEGKKLGDIVCGAREWQVDQMQGKKNGEGVGCRLNINISEGNQPFPELPVF